MNQVKIRAFGDGNQPISAGITIPKDILRYQGIVDNDQLTGEYHVFVTFDRDEGVLKVPIPDATDEREKTPEEQLVERERDQQLSSGERAILEDTTTEAVGGD